MNAGEEDLTPAAPDAHTRSLQKRGAQTDESARG
jgi:hypothetical protein